jgi:hypothetical protein
MVHPDFGEMIFLRESLLKAIEVPQRVVKGRGR